jgi:pimeloyl-ACP methyl ester carboxylesterase
MEHLQRPVAAIDRPGFGASDVPDHPPTMAEYAASAIAVVDDLGWHSFDVVGTHTGSVEAVEIAHQTKDRVRTVGIVAVPAYTPQEVEERLGGVAAPRPGPASDGTHLGRLWRRRLSLRTPPYDLGHLGTLFTDEVLSMPTVHWTYRAVLSYPMLERIRGVPRLVVFAPHDDLWELTARSRPSLPAGARFIELEHLDFDLWERAPDEMARLLDGEIPAAEGLDGRNWDC